ncbi:hypothetical protein DPMN_024554 [Dreissena polymorpha]|uniref:Uncharacterized protein n=1 Tax=Dreissena polymorpha TaxID=45954 RepID=A0A9D4LPD2_DREPO|nr:hypothetical protein DPMN_024554 [Dreissena polymorpha]
MFARYIDVVLNCVIPACLLGNEHVLGVVRYQLGVEQQVLLGNANVLSPSVCGDTGPQEALFNGERKREKECERDRGRDVLRREQREIERDRRREEGWEGGREGVRGRESVRKREME